MVGSLQAPPSPENDRLRNQKKYAGEVREKTPHLLPNLAKYQREDRKVNIKEICYAYLGYFQLDNNGTNNWRYMSAGYFSTTLVSSCQQDLDNILPHI